MQGMRESGGEGGCAKISDFHSKRPKFERPTTKVTNHFKKIKLTTILYHCLRKHNDVGSNRSKNNTLYLDISSHILFLPWHI